MYPAKNGPFAACRRMDENPSNYPKNYDIDDELFNNKILKPKCLKSKCEIDVTTAIDTLSDNFNNELVQLFRLRFTDRFRNLRGLLRHSGNIASVIDEFLDFDKSESIFESIYVGDTVVRGPDWKWGDQDGGKGLTGTVKGVTRWHPNDAENTMTSCVVVWDHGLYGNYRFDFQGAYDVKVIDRLYYADKERDRRQRKRAVGRGILGGEGGMSIAIGDQVIRGQKNWRWGKQDGGFKGVGTITEIYAAPGPLEGGAMIGVLWDKDRDKYKHKQQKHNKQFESQSLHLHDNPIDENGLTFKSIGDDVNVKSGSSVVSQSKKNESSFMQRYSSTANPHVVNFIVAPKMKRNYKHGMSHNWKSIELSKLQQQQQQLGKKGNKLNEMGHNIVLDRERKIDYESDGDCSSDEEESHEWLEPDFDEMLSAPVAKYKWGIDAQYQLGIDMEKNVSDFLNIDDRCVRGPDYLPPSKFNSNRRDYQSQQGIVLRIEQWDHSRVSPNEIIGDKVWLTWDKSRSFRYGYSGKYDIQLARRGDCFRLADACIRVGDRVERGVFWNCGDEDGGDGSKGTVTCIQSKQKVVGLIVRVKWHRNNHVNQYSWGFQNIFDLKKLDVKGCYKVGSTIGNMDSMNGGDIELNSFALAMAHRDNYDYALEYGVHELSESEGEGDSDSEEERNNQLLAIEYKHDHDMDLSLEESNILEIAGINEQDQYEISIDLSRAVGFSFELITKLPKCIVLLNVEMGMILQQIWLKIEEYISKYNNSDQNWRCSHKLTHYPSNREFIVCAQSMTECDRLRFNLTVCLLSMVNCRGCMYSLCLFFCVLSSL